LVVSSIDNVENPAIVNLSRTLGLAVRLRPVFGNCAAPARAAALHTWEHWPLAARGFDRLSRAIAFGGTRRRFLRVVAGLTAGGIAVGSRAVSADTSNGVGSGEENVACVPRPGLLRTSDAAQPPFPAILVSGTCESPDLSDPVELFALVPGGLTSEGKPVATDQVGAAAGVPVSQSVTTIHTSLGELITTPHAIIVQAGEKGDTVIACADIGGLRNGDDLAFAIRDTNGAGWGGVTWLRGQEGSALVYLFLAPGLGAPTSVEPGKMVVTLEEVNLRDSPTVDGGVVSVLPKGTEVKVTGQAQGDWIPVEDPSSKDTGYIAAHYLAAKE
jgi:Bacterial SH3 domain